MKTTSRVSSPHDSLEAEATQQEEEEEEEARTLQSIIRIPSTASTLRRRSSASSRWIRTEIDEVEALTEAEAEAEVEAVVEAMVVKAEAPVGMAETAPLPRGMAPFASVAPLASKAASFLSPRRRKSRL